MGNIISRKRSKNEINELNKRLLNLEKLDRNNDGRVTKEEFNLWLNEQKLVLETYKDKLEAKFIKELSDAECEIVELKNQIESLKNINCNLEKKLQNNSREVDLVNLADLEPDNKIPMKKLSDEQIMITVDKILKNEKINIKYLPDFVERQIYKNVLTILINLLNEALVTSKIELLGFNINFNLEPNTNK